MNDTIIYQLSSSLNERLNYYKLMLTIGIYSQVYADIRSVILASYLNLK